MFSYCPRPCSGLVSAAIFISAGVVQLIAGAILLRSKYVFLLSGPDFWTGATNISVGCLVGVAVSVWKTPKQRRIATYIARYHLMTALLLSSIIMNGVTAAILILGEGNALLSIRLEQNDYGSDSTLAREILGYAYAASVISPIVCSAVAVVSMLTICCPEKRRPLSNYPVKVSKRRSKKVFSENDSAFYSWVFSPKRVALAGMTSPAPRSSRSPESPVFEPASTIPRACISSPMQAFSRKPSLEARRTSFHYLEPRMSAPELSFAESSTREPSPNNETAGSVVPVRLLRTIPRNFSPGIPVKIPVIPSEAYLTESWKKRKLAKSNFGTYSVLPRNKSGKVSFIVHDNKLQRRRFSSFQGDDRPRRARFFSEYPMPVSTCPYPKKWHSQKVAPMDSIREENEDRSLQLQVSNLTSGYGSSPDVSFSSPFAENLDQNSVLQEEEMTTPKQFWSPEGNGKIPRIWRRRQAIVCDFESIIDEDSLIGLSHLELIARCYRDRNLYKIIQQRILNF